MKRSLNEFRSSDSLESQDKDSIGDSSPTCKLQKQLGLQDEEEFKKYLSTLTPDIRRKERNKFLAKKSREKSKMELQYLKEKYEELKKENMSLQSKIFSIKFPAVEVKHLVEAKYELPHSLHRLAQIAINKHIATFNECKSHFFDNNSFSHSLTSCSDPGFINLKNSFMLPNTKFPSFYIINAISPNHSIVYVSESFTHQFGYLKSELIGKSCHFLYEDVINPSQEINIKNSIFDGRDYTTTLTFRHKDASMVPGHLQLSHLKDLSNKTFFIVGSFIEFSA